MSKAKKAPVKSTAKKSTTKKKASTKKKATTIKAKSTSTKKTAAKTNGRSSSKKAADKTVDTELELLNETGRRKENIKPPVERRKRRRQIDPTTCERDYSGGEIEFMQAMDDYKRQSGRMFPTCSEILEVLANMGYRKVADATEIYSPAAEKPTEEQADEQAEETLDAMEEEFA